jgi:hypothetical protein
MGYYDTAVVCRAGHFINDHAGSRPQFNKKFCPQCGEAGLSACEHCGHPIQGDYIAEGVLFLGAGPSQPDPYCPECGQAYPWQAAKVASGAEDSSGEPRMTSRGTPARRNRGR